MKNRGFLENACPPKRQFCLIPLIFAVFLSSMSQSSPIENGGNGVGNHGDELRNVFRQSKIQIADRIRGLRTCSFGGDENSDDVSWILAHQDALANDVEQTVHNWTIDELSTCAVTNLEPLGALLLSFPTCGRSTNTASSIQKLLIHESVHHFGIQDEEFADRIAGTIVRSSPSISCPDDQPETYMSSGPWGTFAIVGKDFLYSSTDSTSGVAFASPWNRPLNRLRSIVIAGTSCFAAGAGKVCTISNGCALDKTGIVCAIESRFDVWNTSEFKTIGIVSGIFGNGGGSATFCWTDALGLGCVSNNPHFRGRFSQFSSIQQVAVGENSLCLLSEGKVFCGASGYKFVEISGLSHPRLLVASQTDSSTTCALDDEGIKCWWGSHPKAVEQTITEVSLPDQIAINSYYVCALDEGKIKCWTNPIVKKTPALVLGNGLPRDTKISLEVSRLCYAAKNQGLVCVNL